eukprot:CAMPEP_0180217958 /NCGR_PEP_ID=MMETSP0987-20121128/17336_1 /TAXON_ID=697907 /ORGANISM="non described non described, Strain CCMP2293" /LENGTH=57 /DNA_ID=CAMNT_0022177777 /DNA_START=55 /DNA_END=224 /DNA_ORIENTATION=-
MIGSLDVDSLDDRRDLLAADGARLEAPGALAAERLVPARHQHRLDSPLEAHLARKVT